MVRRRGGIDAGFGDVCGVFLTGHALSIVAMVVALGLLSVALVAWLGVGWGCLCAAVVWGLVAALLVDVEAMQR